MEGQNAPFQGEPTNQPSTSSTLTTIAPGLDKKELRQKMIGILASTANGCLQELGYYPGIHDKLQQLEKRASDWQSENVKLFNDNRRLHAMFLQQKQLIERLQAEDQRKTTAMQHLKVENGALNKSVEELETALLKKDPSGAADLFNRKYNSLLKEYQALSGEHKQLIGQLSQFKRIQSSVAPIAQQAQQIAQNVQQTHQVQSSQQQQPQQPQQGQQQIPTQYPPLPTVASHQLHPSASIFTSLNSLPVHRPPHQQNVVYQHQIQSGISSDRRPSGSIPGPSQQPLVQAHPYLNMQQQQQVISAQAQQIHQLAPPNQSLNPYPNGSTQVPQRANTYPIVPGQSVQHPQHHPSQPQRAPTWTSSPQPNQPAGNQLHPQGLWINTSSPSVQNTSSPGPMSSPKTIVQTPNSAPFPPVSPHYSQFGRSSATPNAPSRPSSLSQASSPIVPLVSMPQNHPLNAHVPSHSPSLKRNSLSISNTPSQSGDDVSHKRPRIDGPPMVPKDLSGLPSPITPSVQHVHAMPGPVTLIRPTPPPAPHLQSSPAPLTAQHSTARPVEVTQPVKEPVTPAQSQSPQPPHAVAEQSSQKELKPEAEAMAVDADQSTNRGSAETSMNQDTVQQADEDDEDGEIVEVGPDGLRLVSDCLDELFGNDRSGTFICKFCEVRHKMNLRSEPAVAYESPSDEVLAQHLTSDHKAVWDRARAVDD